MKTYLHSNLDSLAKYSKTIDAKVILYNKKWEVFNENSEKEVLIFRPSGKLLIVRQGIVSHSTWELLPAGVILISNGPTTYLFNTAFADENVLVLQLDGTIECMVIVNKEAAGKLTLNSLRNIELYLEGKCKEETHNDLEKADKQSNDQSSKILFIDVIFILLLLSYMLPIIIHIV